MKTIKTINKTNQKYSNHQLYPGIYCKCPDCNGNIVYGMVSCPDDKDGCCVAHYNYGCEDCKTVFNITFEKDQYDDLSAPKMEFREEIGLAIINPRGLKNLTVIKK